MTYQEFLQSKSVIKKASGFAVNPDLLNPMLFEWQRNVVAWALAKGKSALFEACGLGKTAQQLEWSHQVARYTGGDILVLTPLTVAEQTKREGDKFGIPVNICRSQNDVAPGINVTNYEMLEHFDCSRFAGVVLDESSILKSYNGSTRQKLTQLFSDTPYRLACSATPAPNDHMELGTHSEFLGIMGRSEMLAMFFTHDGGDTSKWRLKGHAESVFWKWVCSWAVMIQKPSDIGYSDDGYVLPPIQRHQHTVELKKTVDGFLFTPDVLTLSERREVRHNSLNSRVSRAAELVNNSDEQWLVWCDFNDESAALAAAIQDAVEVTGSDSREHKTNAALDFISGKIRVLVSKPSIFGYGLNMQNCFNIVFVGLSDSFEQIYQAERRCWRFGQHKSVNVHVVTSDGDGPVVRNIERKESDFDRMVAGMVQHMKDEMEPQVTGQQIPKQRIRSMPVRVPEWLLAKAS